MSSNKKSATKTLTARLLLNDKDTTKKWLKSKGYIHITPQINTTKNYKNIVSKVCNPIYVENYCFFPLIHSIIKERKYKRIQKNSKKRAHSFKDSEGTTRALSKSRPLHYASNMDAMIFGYYASLLQKKYDALLKLTPELDQAVIAYRKIEIESTGKGKSTIHFAHEIFQEIKKRSSEEGECCVVAYDIDKFFPSLDHNLLKQAWCDLLNVERLSKADYNVFKAATQFSYIMKDELRLGNKTRGRRPGFDEKRLALIRNKLGYNALFESPKDFRIQLKDKKFKIYKKPFRNKETNEPTGIPQGLPISAVLANLYLLSFDKIIYDELISIGCFYRRYSDDIAIICKPDQKKIVDEVVANALLECKVKQSKDKKEIFYIKNIEIKYDQHRNICFKVLENDQLKKAPFVYLGFEFNGEHAHIKSSNLSKFYRRMIFAIKRKSKRAIKMYKDDLTNRPIIYRRQLYKIYKLYDLSKVEVGIRRKSIVKTDLGNYRLISTKDFKDLKANYFTYVNNASQIMEESKILNQIKKHKQIFNDAINRHLR